MSKDLKKTDLKKTDVYKKYIFGEMSKNKKFSLEDLDHLVGSLSTSQAKLLCKYWSGYRKNSVYDYIKMGPDSWNVVTVGVSNIYVEKVNESVNGILKNDEWLLEKIAEDVDVLSHEEFKKQGTIDNRLLGFIAKKAEDKYRIVDGIHRVIRLACDGKKEFELVYY